MLGCLLALGSMAQGVEIQLSRGFLVTHRPTMKGLPEQATTHVNVNLWQNNSQRAWSGAFIKPQSGLSVQWQNLGNTDALGHATAVNYQFRSALYSGANPLRLTMGAGVAYLSEKFKFQENPENIAIGSHFNASIFFRLSQQFAIQRSRLGWVLSFQHYSNASFKTPNLGLNYTALGLTFGLQPEVHPPQSTDYTYPESELVLFGILGSKQLNDFSGENYALGTAELVYTPKSKHLFAYHGFINTTYNGTIPTQNGSFQVLDSAIVPSSLSTSPWQIGVGIGMDFRVGKTTVSLDQGWYLKSDEALENSRFNQLMVQHSVTPKVKLRVMLRSQLTVADFMAVGVGYKLLGKSE